MMLLWPLSIWVSTSITFPMCPQHFLHGELNLRWIPKCVCYAWKELRSSGHNLLEEGLEREARNPMVAVVLWAEPWLPVSWPLLCLAIQFSSDALNSSFLFVSGAMGVVAGDSWGQGKQAAQKESWPHKYSPGVLAPVHRAGGARTFSSHTKRSCSHRNQCRAEWAAWFCSPFLFLSKSLLEMHCLLVIFVLIKIQTVVKKMLPTARQLALQAHDIHCRRLALWLDLPGSEIGSPFLPALYWQATKGPGRLRLAG